MYAIILVLCVAAFAIVWRLFDLLNIYLARKHKVEDRAASSMINDAEVLKLRAEVDELTRRLSGIESNATARAFSRR